MTVNFVYKIFPVLILFAHSLGEWKAGEARGPVIRIAKSHADDAGLLAHELTHVKQFYRTLGLHGLLYLLSKRYRLAAEVEAYREQLKYSPENAELFAEFIADRYNLGTSKQEAMMFLSASI
jgi:hypothetical protein